MIKSIVTAARPGLVCALWSAVTAALMACQPPTPSSPCQQGWDVCFGVCVNTDLDLNHCGSCGRSCLASEICEDRECLPDCGGRTIVCGGRCADTATDRDHCGRCNNPCAPDETCGGGRCVLGCNEPEMLCGEQCENVQTSNTHCGECDNPCEEYEECSQGDCLQLDLPRDCADVWHRGESAGDGTYLIDPDGDGGLTPFQAYCDMTYDGGRWTLVLNYLRPQGTNPALMVRTDSLPLLGSSTLGIGSEPGTDTWGHAGPTLMAVLRVTELRFYGQTSGHSRVSHVTTTDSGCIAYFRSGTGNCQNVLTSYVLDPVLHSAQLPGPITLTTPAGSADQGERAMTEIPFARASVAYWAIAGEGTRWEMDDSGVGQTNSTLHRIWIRTSSP